MDGLFFRVSELLTTAVAMQFAAVLCAGWSVTLREGESRSQPLGDETRLSVIRS
jgi:hypothetical protein